MIHSYLSVQGFYMKTQEWPMSSRLVERFDNWEVLSWWRCSHLTLRIYSCIANGKSKPGAHEHTFEVIRNESVTRTNLHTSCAMWNSAMGASTCIYPAPRPKERSTGCTYSTSQICTKFDNFAWRFTCDTLVCKMVWPSCMLTLVQRGHIALGGYQRNHTLKINASL